MPPHRKRMTMCHLALTTLTILPHAEGSSCFEAIEWSLSSVEFRHVSRPSFDSDMTHGPWCRGCRYQREQPACHFLWRVCSRILYLPLKQKKYPNHEDRQRAQHAVFLRLIAILSQKGLTNSLQGSLCGVYRRFCDKKTIMKSFFMLTDVM